jgi:anaerobic magnesium-protoporphyrin IX monomethyl ester cyclase
MRVLFVWPNKAGFECKPIGISLLTAILRREGHVVDLFDTSFIDLGGNDYNQDLTNYGYFKEVVYPCDTVKLKVDLLREFTKKVESFRPDVVAISALSDEVDTGLEIAKHAMALNVPVIWGNKGAERLIENGQVKAGGMVFVGEAIETLPRELRDFANFPSRIAPGHYFKDLDSLPMIEWDLFDPRHLLRAYDGKIYRSGDHMIGWGCPNSCAYCINEHWRELHGGMKGCMRRYGVDRIVAELKHLKSLWTLGFYKFHDEDFLLKPLPYFEDLARKYRDEVGLPFACMANVKSVTPDRARLLREMGCVSVSIGIETGNPVMRQILNRKEKLSDICDAVHLLKQEKIRVSAFNMIGLPFETELTVIDTLSYNRVAGIEHPNISFFVPLEGTRLYDISVRYGFWKPEWKKELRTDRPALKLPGVSEETLLYYYRNFHTLVTGATS